MVRKVLLTETCNLFVARLPHWLCQRANPITWLIYILAFTNPDLCMIPIIGYRSFYVPTLHQRNAAPNEILNDQSSQSCARALLCRRSTLTKRYN